MAEFPQIDSGLAVPVFKQGDDPIDAINKMMSFLSTVVTSHFPSTNNQLRNSSNPRQQATIHDGREQEGIIQVNKGLSFVFICTQGERSHGRTVALKLKRKRDAIVVLRIKFYWLKLKEKAPQELPKITPDALTEGEWGFEHTKPVFLKEIIPFLKTLKDIFNVFDKDILNEVTEVQIVFNQMEAAVQQYFVDKQCFEIQKKQFLIENDRLLDQIISQDIVNIVVNSSLDINTSVNVNSSAAMNDSVNYVENCNKCLELEAELIKQHNMVEKDEYNRLSKSFSKLEQHCISLELAMQLNKEIFQKNNTSVNQTEPSFDQLFELNNLKAELQAKDTTIEKLKANIKRLNKTSTTNSVKKDIDEIETINIELEHRVAKLIAENEHLK
ncbi:hypothetical protein Tco_0127460 [Tanacetum coccineum]